MARPEKVRREREFDARTFLVAVVVLGVLIALVLWLLVAVRGHRMLPPQPNREPHSQPGQHRSGGRVMPGDSLYAGGQFTGPIHSTERVS